MLSMEAGWRRISAEEDGLERLCAMVNDNLRLQVLSLKYEFLLSVFRDKLSVVHAVFCCCFVLFWP